MKKPALCFLLFLFIVFAALVGTGVGLLIDRAWNAGAAAPGKVIELG